VQIDYRETALRQQAKTAGGVSDAWKKTLVPAQSRRSAFQSGRQSHREK